MRVLAPPPGTVTVRPSSVNSRIQPWRCKFAPPACGLERAGHWMSRRKKPKNAGQFFRCGSDCACEQPFDGESCNALAALQPAERCGVPPAYGAPYGGSMRCRHCGIADGPRRPCPGGPLVRRGGIKPPAADRKLLNSYRLIFPRRGGAGYYLVKSVHLIGQVFAASFWRQLSAPA